MTLGTLSLVVRRTIPATVERVFDAWTQPEQVMRWWGPRGVRCVGAELDMRVGGRYRIGNALPDGTILWIAGEFEVVEPPHKLVYSWSLGQGDGAPERVTVRFEPKGDACEVIVVHEKVATP